MKLRVWACLVSILALAAACAPAPSDSDAQDESAPAETTPEAAAESAAVIAQGRAIAERECGGCHALDADTDSPHGDAPPLADVLLRYDQDALANDLIEGIQLGHDDMPLFDFNVMAADALVAYLKSIRPAPAAASE